MHNLSQTLVVGAFPDDSYSTNLKYKSFCIPHIQMSASIFGYTRTNDNLRQWHHTWNSQIFGVFFRVFSDDYIRLSSGQWVCIGCYTSHSFVCHQSSCFVRTASLKKEKKKDRVWWNGKETDYRKTATARQTNCPAFLCESFWGNNSDGWEDERPVSWGHMLISLFSAISLFANHYPWHTLLFYPSIKMREGRKRERERWMHLVTCSNITWCAGPQLKKLLIVQFKFSINSEWYCHP